MHKLLLFFELRRASYYDEDICVYTLRSCKVPTCTIWVHFCRFLSIAIHKINKNYCRPCLHEKQRNPQNVPFTRRRTVCPFERFPKRLSAYCMYVLFLHIAFYSSTKLCSASYPAWYSGGGNSAKTHNKI